jgi:hypothetical protein
MYTSFVRYQSRLIRVFDQLAVPYGFQVVNASQPADRVLNVLKTAISPLFEERGSGRAVPRPRQAKRSPRAKVAAIPL